MTAFGLTIGQHDGLGRLLAAAGITVREAPPARPRPPIDPDTALRVMILGDEYPIYSPRTERRCVYFMRDLTRATITIEMFGDNLSGFIDVTIGGTLYRTNCQLGTDELRAWFGFDSDVCRVTSFPGLWEFAYAPGETAPEFLAEPGPGTSGGSPQQFRGGVVVTYEGWVSVDNGGGELDTVDVIDTIPFAEGEVTPGAIAIARWSSSVGWFVEKWQCREFRFTPEQL